MLNVIALVITLALNAMPSPPEDIRSQVLTRMIVSSFTHLKVERPDGR